MNRYLISKFYENGITEPDIDTFLQLCELYELDYAGILAEAYALTIQGENFSFITFFQNV